MRIHYPTRTEPATPEYVLAVLQDRHRQQCEYDPEAEPTGLSMSSTVAEWRDACDLVPWHPLGRALNEEWRVSISDEEWKAVLEPSSSRRLGEVCELLARHAVRPVIRPACLFGSTCNTAGAFLTIRSLLHDAGASVHDVRPSTPLALYSRRFPKVFLGEISTLSPGTLPLVRINAPIETAAAWIFLIGLLAAVAGSLLGLTTLTVIAFALIASGYALAWFSARFLEPASVEFGSLQTFGDLARTISTARKL